MIKKNQLICVINPFPSICLCYSLFRSLHLSLFEIAYYILVTLLVDKVKEIYRELFKMHKIYSVENDRIVLNEVDISDFAIKLKKALCSQQEDNIIEEVTLHIENLIDITGDFI